MSAPSARAADIFCRVVDNFGDIGVCWRLARGLALEHGWDVRLWVDDLPSFARLAPTLNIAAHRQRLGSIDVIAWRADDLAEHAPVQAPAHMPTRAPVQAPAHTPTHVAASRPAACNDLLPRDLVIEAFACDPPPAFIRAMRARTRPPLWLNLEYLSAEDWIEGCHGLASLRSDGLEKIFCFPGFTVKTAGLLREHGLLAARDRFQADRGVQSALLAECGVSAPARAKFDAGAHVVTVFCYPDAPLGPVFAALAQREHPVLVVAAKGVAPQIDAALASLAAPLRRRLTLCRIPFVPHDRFDRLLWLASLNVVRGEDSLVRGVWAGRPLLWQIYPQEDAFHDIKLAAFLARTGWPQPAARANQAFSRGQSARTEDFACLHDAPLMTAWTQAAHAYCATLAQMRDLATTVASYGLRATP